MIFSGSRDVCSYCASPLVVVDLPRLATALRQRVGHWSDSPPPENATSPRIKCEIDVPAGARATTCKDFCFDFKRRLSTRPRN